jgi:hypothetical protein
MNFGASRRCGDVKQFQRDTPKREALIWLGGRGIGFGRKTS